MASEGTPASERPGESVDLLAGLAAVVASSSLAGSLTGAYWHNAGLLIGLGYWGLYLGSVALAVLGGRRRLAAGMLAALPIALPAFFGLAVMSAFHSAFS